MYYKVVSIAKLSLFEVNLPLTIALSSRAIFDLRLEHAVFKRLGLKAYDNYQNSHRKEMLKPGTGYSLLRKINFLNNKVGRKVIDVVLMSKNSASTSFRVINTLKASGLKIDRFVFNDGFSVVPFLSDFDVDLFLTADPLDAQAAMNQNIASASLFYSRIGSKISEPKENEPLMIAFDGDAVIFSDESEKVYQESGLDAFLRAMYTFSEWGLFVNRAFSMGGKDKTGILPKISADIFFDDHSKHVDRAQNHIPTGKVPSRLGL